MGVVGAGLKEEELWEGDWKWKWKGKKMSKRVFPYVDCETR